VETGSQRVATLHHGNLDLDAFAGRLIAYLDGTHTPEEVSGRLATDLLAGLLAPPQGVQPQQWPRERLEERTRFAVTELLSLFARYGILEGETSTA
jgi:hypothetical protein